MLAQNSNIKSINFFFWLFTISVAFILTLPILIQDGMFLDGVLYSAVSHNLANGIGTFWFPSFSLNNLAGMHNSFHEQPPLVFGIQALFFKVFGNSFYVERFYTFITLLANIILIKKLWEIIFKENEKIKSISWLPVLFWITIPVCFWSYSNNMHENTVSIFILFAIIFQFKAFQENKNGNALLFIFISGIFIFLASFSKGLPGLFPLVVPFLFLFKNDKVTFKKALLYSVILLAIVAGIYGIILLNKNARESLYNYFFLRLLKRVNDVPTTTNYLDTLFRLGQESIIQIGIILIVKLSTKKFKLIFPSLNSKAILFLSIGFMGILPLMLTLVQKGFYMVPALPFIAIGLSIFIANEVYFLACEKLPESKFSNYLKSTFGLIAIVSIILPILNIGKFSRDKEKLRDIHLIGTILPNHAVINCSKELLSDWSLQTYLSRYYFISLDINAPHSYFLCDKSEFLSKKEAISKDFELLNLDLKEYCLLKKL